MPSIDVSHSVCIQIIYGHSKTESGLEFNRVAGVKHAIQNLRVVLFCCFSHYIQSCRQKFVRGRGVFFLMRVGIHMKWFQTGSTVKPV